MCVFILPFNFTGVHSSRFIFQRQMPNIFWECLHKQHFLSFNFQVVIHPTSACHYYHCVCVCVITFLVPGCCVCSMFGYSTHIVRWQIMRFVVVLTYSIFHFWIRCVSGKGHWNALCVWIWPWDIKHNTKHNGYTYTVMHEHTHWPDWLCNWKASHKLAQRLQLVLPFLHRKKTQTCTNTVHSQAGLIDANTT